MKEQKPWDAGAIVSAEMIGGVMYVEAGHLSEAAEEIARINTDLAEHHAELIKIHAILAAPGDCPPIEDGDTLTVKRLKMLCAMGDSYKAVLDNHPDLVAIARWDHECKNVRLVSTYDAWRALSKGPDGFGLYAGKLQSIDENAEKAKQFGYKSAACLCCGNHDTKACGDCDA